MKLHHETPKAILVSDDGDPDHAKWLPKSEVEFEEVRNKVGYVEVTMPTWLAIEKGLV